MPECPHSRSLRIHPVRDAEETVVAEDATVETAETANNSSVEYNIRKIRPVSSRIFSLFLIYIGIKPDLKREKFLKKKNNA